LAGLRWSRLAGTHSIRSFWSKVNSFALRQEEAKQLGVDLEFLAYAALGVELGIAAILRLPVNLNNV
jgi:hypothetical protein